MQVEFAWGTDIYVDRQIVAEKLALATERLPEGVRPQMGPISSIMGQIMIVGMWSEGGKTAPMEVRTLADWVVRQRLLTIPRVAQVITMGGGRKQYQVLINPERAGQLRRHAPRGRTGDGGQQRQRHGRLPEPRRPRVSCPLASAGCKASKTLRTWWSRPIASGPCCSARWPEWSRRRKSDGATRPSTDVPAVMLTIAKQPGADTRRFDRPDYGRPGGLESQSAARHPHQPASVPAAGVHRTGHPTTSSTALRDGGILVVVILCLFLLNFRTTFITLTAIPLSIVVTGLVFKWFGMSINTMTLGRPGRGHRRTGGRRHCGRGERLSPAARESSSSPPIPGSTAPADTCVVYEASSEVRNSIVFSTILVVLVFVPLFALSGMEGRLFYALGNRLHRFHPCLVGGFPDRYAGILLLALAEVPGSCGTMATGFVLRWLKWLVGVAIRFSMRHPWPVLGAVAAAMGMSSGAGLTVGPRFPAAL